MTMRQLTSTFLVALMTSAIAFGGAPPKTSWGTPSFNGTWTSATLTPLERPIDAKDTLSVTERQSLEATAVERRARADNSPPPEGSVGGYNQAWLDPGMKMLADGRSALILVSCLVNSLNYDASRKVCG